MNEEYSRGDYRFVFSHYSLLADWRITDGSVSESEDKSCRICLPMSLCLTQTQLDSVLRCRYLILVLTKPTMFSIAVHLEVMTIISQWRVILGQISPWNWTTFRWSTAKFSWRHYSSFNLTSYAEIFRSYIYVLLGRSDRRVARWISRPVDTELCLANSFAESLPEMLQGQEPNKALKRT